MKLRYLGPCGSINIAGFGTLRRNETGDFREGLANELLASKRQRFVAADPQPLLTTQEVTEKRGKKRNE